MFFNFPFFIFLIHYKRFCFGYVQQSPPSQLHSSSSNLCPLKELCYIFFFYFWTKIYLNSTQWRCINAAKVCLIKKGWFFVTKLFDNTVQNYSHELQARVVIKMVWNGGCVETLKIVALIIFFEILRNENNLLFFFCAIITLS